MEHLIVTLVMTSFFVIQNQLQHFTKLTALEIKLEIMLVVFVQKSRVLSCVTWQRTFKLISIEKVNNNNLPCSRMCAHERSMMSIQHRLINIDHLMSDYSLIWLRHNWAVSLG